MMALPYLIAFWMIVRLLWWLARVATEWRLVWRIIYYPVAALIVLALLVCLYSEGWYVPMIAVLGIVVGSLIAVRMRRFR